jgi:hypothetical protein
LSVRVRERELRELYVEQELSLQEIADRYGCTRVMILYLMKRHGIPRRSHSQARRNALRDGKIQYTVRRPDGGTRSIRHQRTTLNEHFFRGWSPEMAYVLGVFYTDGCIHLSRIGNYTAKISQKEPELLEKCLVLMKCDAPLHYRPNNSPAGGLYTFAVNHQNVCRDLLALGLHPRKSRTLQFPDLPFGLLRDFIRGCWDGDGSIYRSGKGPAAWNAKFVSGSPAFARGMHDAIVFLGMPPVTIHRDRRYTTVAYFRWTGKRCGDLFHILYDRVPESQYLLRKYERFRAAAAENRA